MTSSTLRRALLALACAALAACADSPSAVPAGPAPAAPTVATVECTASVAARSVRCSPPPAEGGDIVLGGQRQYVFLFSDNLVVDPADRTFNFTVTVQNLIPQPLGTTDGTTPDGEGVRVVFHSGPTTTKGSGLVRVVTPDTGTFTRANQPFYRYANTVLPTNATSGELPWSLSYDEGVETFSFLLYVVAAVPFPQGYVDVTPPADSLEVGATVQAAATVRTAVGNPVAGETVTWSSSAPAVATVSAAGLVTAVAPGTATITATSGTRTGSARIEVCHAVAVGEVATLDGAGAAGFCLPGATGAEYALIPTFRGEDPALPVSVTGAGIVPVTGAPTPDVAPLRADAWEAAFRARQFREAASAPRARAGRVQGPRFAITPGVPSVGALITINVEQGNLCSTSDIRTGRVTAVGTHAIVVADTLNPSGGFTSGQYAALANLADSVIYPAVTDHFGAPSDRDGNGRVVLFFTSAVNELVPPGQPAVVGWSSWRDLRSTSACPTSNVGELIYLMVPDPAGSVNGNVRPVAQVRSLIPGKVAHELQHVVNASRRLSASPERPLEEPWLDEGLSHIAEELAFRRATGIAPRSNTGIADVVAADGVEEFAEYAEGNLGRLRRWMQRPDTTGAFASARGPAAQGALWAFLRYAADRRGGDESAFWNGLAAGPSTGLANLTGALGSDPLPWYRDWQAAVYTDDAVAGAAVQHTQPGWNFRSIFGGWDFGGGAAFPLAVVNPANGVTSNTPLASGGGAVYLRIGVPASGFAGVTVRSGGAPLPDGAVVHLVRTR